MHATAKKITKKWAGLLYMSSYTPVMAGGADSVSLYLHGFSLLSLIILFISVVFFLLLASFSLIGIMKDGTTKILDPRNGKFNNFTFIAGISTVLLRIDMSYDTYLFAILFSLLLIFTLSYAALFLFLVSMKHPVSRPALSTLWLISGIPLLSTVILVMNSVHRHGMIIQVDFIFSIVAYLLAVSLYILVIYANLIKWMRRGIEIEMVSGATWINVGFGGLITICSYYLITYLPMPVPLRLIVYGIMLATFSLATFLLPFVIFLSLSKIKSTGAVRYYPSLWPSVFSISVYSISSLIISKVFAIAALYYYSTAFEFLSLALLVTYIALLIRSGIVYPSENLPQADM